MRETFTAIPGVVDLEFVYEVVAQLGPEIDHGASPLGQRLHVPIVGGTFVGPRLRGEVVPGGADWQLVRSDGRCELKAIYDMRCDDGTLIHVRNHGLWFAGTDDVPGSAYAMSQPRLEAPAGPYAWLNHRMFVAPFVGDLADTPSCVRLRVYALETPTRR